jgi:hypothetical protein
MKRPEYISAEDARMMRFVDNMNDLLSQRFLGASVVHYPRRVIGDFNALARWIGKRLDVDGGFKMSEHQFPNTLNIRQFGRLRDEMPGAEKFAADQILSDMRAIEAAPEWRSKSRPSAELVVVGSNGYLNRDDLTGVLHHDTHRVEEENQMGRIVSCYTLPVTGFVGHGDAVQRTEEDLVRAGFEKGDVIYDARPGVNVRSFGLTDIWRHAGANLFVEDVLPFVHTAQKQKAGEPPRLVVMGF